MQEDKNPGGEAQEGSEQDTVRDFLSRPQITRISIAVWIFIAGFFLLRLYIYDHVPSDPDRTKVLIESMFSLALGIVIAMQAAIYFRQAKILDAQLDIAQKNLIYAHRAYVAVVRGNYLDNFERGFQLVIANSGNSPAKNVFVRYLVQPGDLPPPVLIDTKTEPIGLLATNAPYDIAAYPSLPIKPEEDEKLLKSKSFRLWCKGTIFYYDIFQTLEDMPHETKFCFYWEPGNPLLRPWQTGNEGD
jgi:hypothetical protein